MSHSDILTLMKSGDALLSHQDCLNKSLSMGRLDITFSKLDKAFTGASFSQIPNNLTAFRKVKIVSNKLVLYNTDEATNNVSISESKPISTSKSGLRRRRGNDESTRNRESSELSDASQSEEPEFSSEEPSFRPLSWYGANASGKITSAILHFQRALQSSVDVVNAKIDLQVLLKEQSDSTNPEI